jgi:hypothetical protein
MTINDPVLHRYSFPDLPLKREWLEILMGYGEGGTPDPLPGIIDGIIAEAPDHADIRGAVIVLDNFRFVDGSRILTEGLEFDTGKTITGSLRNSEKIAFFLMTAGPGIEAWSREVNQNGDPMTAYIIDLLGSEIVESAAELLQTEMEEEIGDKGLKTSNRYSPGHCGWKVSEQKKLFSLFPENYCGISLSDSSLMIPVKSLSGIMGIGERVEKRAHLCEICDVAQCFYRDRKDLLV